MTRRPLVRIGNPPYHTDINHVTWREILGWLGFIITGFAIAGVIAWLTT